MTTITVNRPLPTQAPRGAAWAAGVAAWLLSLGASLRARHATRSVFDEANAVRRLADRMQAEDPRAAADLYAAADRHERD
jgi:hypothetical protein